MQQTAAPAAAAAAQQQQHGSLEQVVASPPAAVGACDSQHAIACCASGFTCNTTSGVPLSIGEAEAYATCCNTSELQVAPCSCSSSNSRSMLHRCCRRTCHAQQQDRALREAAQQRPGQLQHGDGIEQATGATAVRRCSPANAATAHAAVPITLVRCQAQQQCRRSSGRCARLQSHAASARRQCRARQSSSASSRAWQLLLHGDSACICRSCTAALFRPLSTPVATAAAPTAQPAATAAGADQRTHLHSCVTRRGGWGLADTLATAAVLSAAALHACDCDGRESSSPVQVSAAHPPRVAAVFCRSPLE
jgi:hypothetical protein